VGGHARGHCAKGSGEATVQLPHHLSTIQQKNAHAHMHTCTHAHMHTCTHAHMHTCTHAHMHTCTHAHMHTCTHAHMHTCTDVNIDKRAHVPLWLTRLHRTGGSASGRQQTRPGQRAWLRGSWSTAASPQHSLGRRQTGHPQARSPEKQRSLRGRGPGYVCARRISMRVCSGEREHQQGRCRCTVTRFQSPPPCMHGSSPGTARTFVSIPCRGRVRCHATRLLHNAPYQLHVSVGGHGGTRGGQRVPGGRVVPGAHNTGGGLQASP
jgi:hypothetical protein